ncbi:MAG: METTL5 family protein [Candidatus Bathyarchaeia archaeon]|jgi:putative methylase
MRPHPSPRIQLEQYTTPAAIAADILFLAAFVYQDIVGKTVVDLGTGTGRLAIGASNLGARQITAIDIDSAAIEVARENAETARANIDWMVGDLEAIHGEFDTVIMNPPFGTKQRHLDKVFLGKAIQIGRVVYSLHKSTTREHISRFLRRHGCKVDAIHEYTLEIPMMFEHHRKRKHPVKVDCYRVETRGSSQ